MWTSLVFIPIFFASTAAIEHPSYIQKTPECIEYTYALHQLQASRRLRMSKGWGRATHSSTQRYKAADKTACD